MNTLETAERATQTDRDPLVDDLNKLLAKNIRLEEMLTETEIVWPKLTRPIRTSRPSCGTTTMIDAGRPLRLDSRRFTSLLKAELGTQATSACAIETMARSLAAPGAHNAWTSLDDIQTTKHRLARHQADCGRCVFAI